MKYVTTGTFVIYHDASDLEQAERHATSFAHRMKEGSNDGALISEISININQPVGEGSQLSFSGLGDE